MKSTKSLNQTLDLKSSKSAKLNLSKSNLVKSKISNVQFKKQ